MMKKGKQSVIEKFLSLSEAEKAAEIAPFEKPKSKHVR